MFRHISEADRIEDGDDLRTIQDLPGHIMNNRLPLPLPTPAILVPRHTGGVSGNKPFEINIGIPHHKGKRDDMFFRYGEHFFKFLRHIDGKYKKAAEAGPQVKTFHH